MIKLMIKKDVRPIIYINILLVLLLTASIIIFMLSLRPIMTNPDITRAMGNVIFFFIILLSIITAITGIIIFIILSRAPEK